MIGATQKKWLSSRGNIPETLQEKSPKLSRKKLKKERVTKRLQADKNKPQAINERIKR